MNLQQLPSHLVVLEALSEGATYWKLYRYRAGDVSETAMPYYAYRESTDAPDAISPLLSFLQNFPFGTPFTLVYQLKNGGEKFQSNFKWAGNGNALPLQGGNAGIGSIGEMERSLRDRETSIASIVEQRVEQSLSAFKKEHALQQQILELQREIRESKEQNGNFDRKFELILEKGLEFLTNQPPTAKAAVSGPPPANPENFATESQQRMEKAIADLHQKLGDEGFVNGVEKLASFDAETLRTFLSM